MTNICQLLIFSFVAPLLGRYVTLQRIKDVGSVPLNWMEVFVHSTPKSLEAAAEKVELYIESEFL